jgi:glycosyltransferase involved in cell wall biosynthesis
MNYDVVLATRNRQSILKISLQLVLAQTRLPRRVIVVDASDDHREVCNIVKQALHNSGTNLDLEIIESEPGSSLQRNVGLRRVESPVVILPDDDALWFPDSAEHVMRIYERDTEGLVGCVAAKVSSVYPVGAFGSDLPPYKMELRDRLSKNIRTVLGPLEEWLLPDPVSPGGMWMRVWGAKVGPAWLAQENAALCGPVFGYRMSFRTFVIREIGGFDEELGRYAMFEDSDATIGSLCQRLNVLAAGARVYHYRVPGERVAGWEFGMMAILNRAYVVCKHSPPSSRARRMMKRYLRYKMIRYFAQSYSRYGRERLKGAFAAALCLGELLDAPSEQVTNRYTCIRKRVTDSVNSHLGAR